MTVAQNLPFAPPPRDELGAIPENEEDLQEIIKRVEATRAELLEEWEADQLEKLDEQMSGVTEELELVMKQRELLLTLKARIDQLPADAQPEMLRNVMDVLKEAGIGLDAVEEDAPREEAPRAIKTPQEMDARELDLARDLVSTLEGCGEELNTGEKEQLLPIAIHVMQHGRRFVSPSVIIKKIPEVLDAVVDGKIDMPTTELVACALSHAVIGLELAARPPLMQKLEPLELVALLAKSDTMVAEAVCSEAPLEGFGPEHWAILYEHNLKTFTHLGSLPYIRTRAGQAFALAEEHCLKTKK